jgi:hypothetical protein
MSRWKINRERPEETEYIRDSVRLAKRGQVKIHVLQINRRDYGFVAVNIRQFLDAYPDKFYLLVDLLFVSNHFRSAQIDELEGLTASEYLMLTVYNESMRAANFFPFDNIVLYPAHPKLIPFYTSIGYVPLAKTNGFMFISLRSPATPGKSPP